MPNPFQQLRLPTFESRISKEGDEYYIYDPIRKKQVLLTKEEWVRQHFVHLLVDHLGYPRGLIRVEAGLKYYKTAKRSDLVVYNNEGQVHLLLECKNPEVKLTSTTLQQLAVYNKTLNARYVAISNGLQHFCWQREGEGYSPMTNFPDYQAS